jgi:subfamily B ATP-binding cassette protein MsbA
MAGLDSESESLVREALANLMRGRTTLVITHDLPTIQNADRILVLKDGRLVGQGTHAELMAQGGEYRTLYNFEFSASPSAGK